VHLLFDFFHDGHILQFYSWIVSFGEEIDRYEHHHEETKAHARITIIMGNWNICAQEEEERSHMQEEQRGKTWQTIFTCTRIEQEKEGRDKSELLMDHCYSLYPPLECVLELMRK
jgi:hypothetical protein